MSAKNWALNCSNLFPHPQEIYCQNTSQNCTSADCMESRDNCRESLFSSGDFYCADLTAMGTLVWFAIMVVPTLCLNLFTMAYSLRSKLPKVLSMWPPFLFSGNFSPFLFGPMKRREGIYFSMSPRLTILNLVLAGCQTCVALILLNKMTGKMLNFKPITLSIC